VFKPHAETTYFLKSIYEKRPPTAFFPYPKYTKAKRTADRVRRYRRDDVEYLFMSFRINDNTHIYNAVVNTFKNAGFQMVETGNFWNVVWSGKIQPDDIRDLNKYQKINHFPGSAHLGRKDYLWRNLQRYIQKYPKDYDITPATYLLPEEYDRFMDERELENENLLYILKPAASSCGRGIRIIGKRTKVSCRE